jgi:hypothetical protein
MIPFFGISLIRCDYTDLGLLPIELGEYFIDIFSMCDSDKLNNVVFNKQAYPVIAGSYSVGN